MVVDDLPSVRKFAEDQREATVRHLAIGHRQMPGAADEGCFLAKYFDAQVREIQLAHLVSGARIGRPVAIERRLPAAGFFGVGEERQVWRIPIARHEGIKVVAVPGLLLGLEHLFDGGFGIGGFRVASWRERDKHEHEKKHDSGHEFLPGGAVIVDDGR